MKSIHSSKGERKLKYIIFDFDGTLANSAQVYIDAWNSLADKYKYLPITIDDLAEIQHLDNHSKAKKFQFPMHKLSIILPKIYRYFNEHAHEVPLFEGMKEMLETLSSKGYKIIILSSNEKRNIESVLKREDIRTISEILSSKKLFGKDKVIKKFMKQYQLKPEQLLYVGDELRDIQACNKLGVPFMWVSWGLDGYELIEKENPQFIVHTPDDIVAQLNKMTN